MRKAALAESAAAHTPAASAPGETETEGGVFARFQRRSQTELARPAPKQFIHRLPKQSLAGRDSPDADDDPDRK